MDDLPELDLATGCHLLKEGFEAFYLHPACIRFVLKDGAELTYWKGDYDNSDFFELAPPKK